MVDLNLCRVLNEENAFVLGNELRKDIQQGRLAGPGSARNQNVFSGENVVFQLVGKPALQRTRFNQVTDREVAGIEFADGQCDAVQTAGWNDGRDPASVWQPRVQYGFGLGNIVP